MKKVVIYGAGGFGRELACMLERINEIEPQYEILGFLEDGKTYAIGTDINGYKILGKGEWILDHKDIGCICAIANVKVRKRLFEKYKTQGVDFETVVWPEVFVHRTVRIGKGCIICKGCGLTVNTKLEEGVFLNGHVIVGHDVTIGAFSTIFPRTDISGNCIIGTGVTIGGHVFVTPGRRIGDDATIGAGSIVFSNVKIGTTVLGNPAKRIDL